MTEYTPGPWHDYAVTPTELLCNYRVGTGRHAIAGIALTGDSRIDIANARLIAAAPDLLAALETIAQRAIDYPLNEMAWLDAETARAAIAKATS